MPNTKHAAHILSNKYPEISGDTVSRYVARLRNQLGEKKSSVVYSTACRAAPLAENPLGLERGSVVDIEGQKYLTLGCGFMTLEFANLERAGELKTVNADEFQRLGRDGIRILAQDAAASALGDLDEG